MKHLKALAFLTAGIMSITGTGMLNDYYSSELYSASYQTVSAASTLRRPVDADHPMWIVHVETWNTPDPQKIIALIPEDIRPYVVFNISMSIYWDNNTHQWGMVQDGYELAKSWLKSCADAGVWCMVQTSSGGQSHLPDYDDNGNIVEFPNEDEFINHADSDYENTIYAEFFRDYPNFIGFNYCEQFWGFESNDFPITVPQRYQHFAHLLELCNKYGGYLDVSWCGNQWSPQINPLAMLKQVPSWEAACSKYSENFILEEKYTQGSYIEDMESLVYGYYVSGYCGNIGVRYDETGWTDSTWSGTGVSTKDEFNQSTGLPVYLERMVKNGATVIDGPELVTVDDFKETWGTTDSDGYHVREWAMYDQFQNVVMDFMRKITDGSVDIPEREEVVANTKVAVIQDVKNGKSWDENYSSYSTLFEGIYRQNSDGNLKDNHNLYKSTGRYQTIPTVYALKDSLAKSIPVQVSQSSYTSKWSSISQKQEEFNSLYPSEYYGNCYVGRNDNTWIAYNINKNGSNCGAVFTLKYNTCKEMDVNFNAYGNALINEYSDHIDIYTNNYTEKDKTTLRTDTFKISGCSAEPSVTWKDRGVNQSESIVNTVYSNGTVTITVKHNGPVDISVKCSGSETNRSSVAAKQALEAPEGPSFYTGTRQYEAEVFDYKNIEGNVANACGSGVTGIQGQGFMKFGTKANAAVKDIVSTSVSGDFKIGIRYSAIEDINNTDLYVNGTKISALSMKSTGSYSKWSVCEIPVKLKSGDNKIEIKANSVLPSSLYLDCMTVSGDFGNETDNGSSTINGVLIKNLVVNDSENAADWSVESNFGKNSVIYGDRNFICTGSNTIIDGSEYVRTACDSKMYADNQASFEAVKDMYVSLAIDCRVENQLSWLDGWNNTGAVTLSSNGVVFSIYQKKVKAGDKVILGTNGEINESANYIVFVSETSELSYVPGDVNSDGKFNVADVVLIQKWILDETGTKLANEKAGDLNDNGRIDIFDFCLIKNKILS